MNRDKKILNENAAKQAAFTHWKRKQIIKESLLAAGLIGAAGIYGAKKIFDFHRDYSKIYHDEMNRLVQASATPPSRSGTQYKRAMETIAKRATSAGIERSVGGFDDFLGGVINKLRPAGTPSSLHGPGSPYAPGRGSVRKKVRDFVSRLDAKIPALAGTLHATGGWAADAAVSGAQQIRDIIRSNPLLVGHRHKYVDIVDRDGKRVNTISAKDYKPFEDLPDGQKYSLRMGTGGMTNRDKANYRQQIRRIIGLKPLKYALE